MSQRQGPSQYDSDNNGPKYDCATRKSGCFAGAEFFCFDGDDLFDRDFYVISENLLIRYGCDLEVVNITVARHYFHSISDTYYLSLRDFLLNLLRRHLHWRHGAAATRQENEQKHGNKLAIHTYLHFMSEPVLPETVIPGNIDQRLNSNDGFG
jgi:hypothetical protein